MYKFCHLYFIIDIVCVFLYSTTTTTMSASTVKCTALDPCSGLSESDPNLYINFKFYEIEIHKHLENI